jgi:hypothetical protein
MAKEFADKGFVFLFLYTREAHPGQQHGAHTGMEQKLAYAREFREDCQIERPILVDDLSGTVHRLYGELPNMTYLIGRGGRILFRSNWTDVPTIEMMLNYLVNVRARRREGERLAPFYAEFAGYRITDPAKFQAGLHIGGQQAIDDFARMMKIWAERER